jgi:hypothetical protein
LVTTYPCFDRVDLTSAFNSPPGKFPRLLFPSQPAAPYTGASFKLWEHEMLNYLRRRLDESATIPFLPIVLMLTIARPPVYGTPGGMLLAQIVLWSAGILVAALLVAARFSPEARAVVHIILNIGPIILAIVGYISLKLFDAYDITAWLGIQPKYQWVVCCGITLSTVALQVHYGIDDLAALVWIFPLRSWAAPPCPVKQRPDCCKQNIRTPGYRTPS